MILFWYLLFVLIGIILFSSLLVDYGITYHNKKFWICEMFFLIYNAIVGIIIKLIF